MTAILNFSDSLLELGRAHVANRRTSSGAKVLQRLLELSDVPSRTVAEANYLLGQIHFEKSNFESAEDCLIAALDHDDNHVDANYLLAKTMQKQSGGADELVVRQYRQAAALAPNDAVRKCAYGRALIEYDRSERGLRILKRTYLRHKADPAVVEEVLHGLVAGRKYDAAQKVLRSAARKKADDPRFQRICLEFNRRRLKENWPQSVSPQRGEAYVVRFPKAVGAEMPAVAKATGKAFRVVAAAETRTLPKLNLHADELLLDLLDRSSDDHLARISEVVGCTAADKVDASNAIARKLDNPVSLKAIVDSLPPGSKKLLRTLLRVGGVVPAAVLEQNVVDGDAPHPAAALSDAGLIFIGNDNSRPSGKPAEIAVIPVDLHKRLAKLNRIKVGVRQ